jgi:tetratricopeptide (TPR) repeat protein
MLDLMQLHLDEFTLLCYVSGEVPELEKAAVEIHLKECSDCRATLAEIQRLDKELALLANDAEGHPDWYAEELPTGDPFRRRPAARRRPPMPTSVTVVERLARASAASENAAAASDALFRAVKDPGRALTEIFSTLSPSSLTDRFALLYALQEAGLEIAESPSCFMAFAEEVVALSGSPTWRQSGQQVSEEERALPCLLLRAEAHRLAGQACLWTGQFEEAGAHLRSAYRAFGIVGDETGTARVELLEAQRRYFIGRGEEALILARRSGATFAMLGLEDERARCRGAEGLALFQLGRFEESAQAFRSVLGVFEVYQLWSNYVGSLNSIATALVKMGRLDEARRDYARALRKLSRERHRSWLPFIRKGLAEVLFSAERYREAATQASRAARLFTESGQLSRSLVASLFEVESWARAGDFGRARHRLDIFRSEVERHGKLDPTLARLIDQALSSSSMDFREIAELRKRADSALREGIGKGA